MKSRASWRKACWTAVGLSCGAALPVSASPPPDYDFDWAEIRDLNNPAYDGPDLNGQTVGRGSVGYAYRMPRLEITTAQWMEFANAMGALGEPFRIGEGPNFWGARRTGSAPGTFQYELRSNWPNPGMMPVIGISWYNAARYCNWLHNGKALSLEALATGAYDTSSWYTDPDGRVHADERHLPGADFWIPTKDEWLKAAHYDPTKDGVGGWWQSPHQSDDPIIYGAPWEGGQSNAYYEGDDLSLSLLALYPEVRSYYGLLDLSGGATEWNEDFRDVFVSESNRIADGTSTRLQLNTPAVDLVYSATSRMAFDEATIGLRIASRIPGSPVVAGLVLGLYLSVGCRRRRT